MCGSVRARDKGGWVLYLKGVGEVSMYKLKSSGLFAFFSGLGRSNGFKVGAVITLQVFETHLRCLGLAIA